MEQIAIVGARLRVPGASSLQDFWTNILEGRDSIESLSPEALKAAGVPATLASAPGYVARAGTIPGIEDFDHEFFGYTFREARAIDPQQRLLLTLSHQLLEEVGADTSNVGMFASTGFPSYLLKNAAPSPEARTGMADVVIGNAQDCTATRIAFKLDLCGPAMTIQSGCSSSLVSLHMARLALLTGQCDMALVGAASLRIPQHEGYAFQRDGVVSSDGVCRPFDAEASGTLFTSGAVVVALKKLSKALADGDDILSVLCGSAANNDGQRKAGFTAPSVKGQMEAIQKAYARAKIDPRSIGYLEAHGTGTSLGDPIEIQALTEAFGTFTSERGFCSLGSVKGNVGHLDVASGLVGVVKASLCLKHRVKPPLANFTSPSPKLDLERSPFHIQTHAAEWVTQGDAPRRAAVSSLGVGGTNGHVILEEAPARHDSSLTGAEGLVLLSARNPAALETRRQSALEALTARPEWIGDAAYSSQLFQRVHALRGALWLRSTEEGLRSLPLESTGDWRHHQVAFVFPGQGTQFQAMGLELYSRWEEFRARFDHCAELFAARGVVDPRRMLQEQDLDASDTLNLQPFLFTVEYALGTLLMHLGLMPDVLMGHSLGEYVAATLAGVFSLEDAVKLVAERSRIMSRAPRGAMLAVICTEEELAPHLGERLSLSVVNGARNRVVGGSVEDIQALRTTLTAQGVKSVVLKTSHAFHSYLMESAAEELRAAFEGITLNLPRTKLISNEDGRWDRPERFTSPDYWARHLREPVRFFEGLQTLMASADSTIIIETGPGQSIKGNLASSFSQKPAGLFDTLLQGKEMERLGLLLGQCWANGRPVDWRALYKGRPGHLVPFAPHPLAPKRCWIDASTDSARDAQVTPESAHHKQEDLGRWLFEQRWLPRASEYLEGLSTGEELLVLTGPRGLSEALVERLRSVGALPTSVDLTELLTREGLDSIDAAAAAVKERVGGTHGARKVLALLPLLVDEASGACEQIIRANLVLLGVCRALRPAKGERLELLLMSSQAYRTTEEDVRWWQSWVDGFALVAQQEVPGVGVRVLDVGEAIVREPQPEQLDLLVTECMEGRDRFVALRGRTMWTREIRRVAPRPEGRKPPEAPRNVVIIGGTGNVGLVYATHFARKAGTNVTLVSRSAASVGARLADKPLPEGRIWARRSRLLETTRAEGGQLLFLDADTSDIQALRKALSEARSRMGSIDAIVHAAGAAAEIHYRLMFESQPEFLKELLAPKMQVALTLDRVAREFQVPRVLVVSSISAVLGGLGLYGYTLSHSLLDAFARAVSDRACRWTTIDWDAWEFYKDGRAAEARDVGIDALAITEAEGLSVLGRVSDAGWPEHVVVSSGDLEVRYRSWVLRGAETREPATTTNRIDRPQLKDDFVAPRSPVESTLAELWAENIGLKSVGTRDNFFELGGHSLSAIALVEDINRRLDSDLQVVDIFKYPTIEKLAERLTPKTLTDVRKGREAGEAQGAPEGGGRNEQRRNYFRTMKGRQGAGRDNE
ncbi:MAG: beta-ketoacyl synthase N-terminal-like domain-containing protein [Cystobacter sp.]